MKSLFSSKTFWIAVAQGLVGILVVVETSIPELGWVTVVKSVIDIYVRAVTNTPVKIG